MAHRELYLPDSSRTGGIVLPATTRNEIFRDKADLRENLFSIAAVKADFDRDLKQIDDHLEIVKAKDQTTVVGLKAGYWHIIRMNPGHPADVLVLEHPDGSYREPDSSLFDFVMESDLYNDRARKAHRKRQEEARRASERRRERESQDRIDEIGRRVKSRNSTQIHVRRKY